MKIAKYVEMRTFLSAEIDSGRYQVGDQLPTLDQLNAKFVAVGPSTGMRAYAELVELGMVERRHGVGYFLTSVTPVEHSDNRSQMERRLDSIESSLEAALAEVRSLREASSGVPQIGESWEVLDRTDGTATWAHVVPGRGQGQRLWITAASDRMALMHRNLEYFDPIRRLPDGMKIALPQEAGPVDPASS